MERECAGKASSGLRVLAVAAAATANTRLPPPCGPQVHGASGSGGRARAAAHVDLNVDLLRPEVQQALRLLARPHRRLAALRRRLENLQCVRVRVCVCVCVCVCECHKLWEGAGKI